MRTNHLLPIVVAASLLAACGARAPRTDAPVAGESIEMEAMVVAAIEEDGRQVVEAYDAQQLFEDGKNAFDRQDFDACDRTYRRLIELFPDSLYIPFALYNRGLCLERLGQFQQAAAAFRRYAQIATDLRDRRDGEFRWGYNLVRTGENATAVHLYTRLLEAEDIGPADRAECHLRRGTALLNLGRFGEAEKDLKQSMDRVREAYEGHVEGNELFAEAHFRRGEIYQRLSHKVPLKLPIAKMKNELGEKVRFFKQARDSYIDALNVQHSHWQPAALLKLGELYEQFYLDVLGAEVPADFSRDEKYYYLIELKKLLQPILEQSLAIYEKNITMSERIGIQNEWVVETERRIERLRSLIEESERLKTAPALPPAEPKEPPEQVPPPGPPTVEAVQG